MQLINRKIKEEKLKKKLSQKAPGGKMVSTHLIKFSLFSLTFSELYCFLPPTSDLSSPIPLFFSPSNMCHRHEKKIVHSQQSIPLNNVKLNSLNKIKNKDQIFLPKRYKTSFLLHFFNIHYYMAWYSYVSSHYLRKYDCKIQDGGRFAERKKNGAT